MNRQSMVSFLRGLSLVGVYGGLLMPLMFLPVVIFPFVFSKLIFLQILIGITFPAYVMLAWMEPRYRPRYHVLSVAIAAYFVALLLSVIFAVDPFRAWWGNQERMNGLFTLLHFLAWITMAVSLLDRWPDWRRLLNYEVVLSAFMAIVALLQKPFPRLLLFPASARVGGLLDNPIYMGTYQIFNLAFLALLFFKRPSPRMKVVYGLIALLDFSAFIAAQSRGDLVGLAAGILVFAFIYGVFHQSRRTRSIVLAVTACLFVAYGLLFAFRNTSLVANSPFARLTNFSSSVSTRLIAWRIAWDGFLERPVTGWGLDNFHLLFNSHYNPLSLRYGSYETWFDRSHNTILDVLSMTGIIGFLTFMFIYLALAFSVYRAFRKQWIDLSMTAILIALPAGYFVQNLFVFDHPAAFSMSFLMFGLVIAATRGAFFGDRPEPQKSATPPASRSSWPAFIVLEVIALLIVWRTSALPFYASYLSINANNAFASPQAYDLMLAASKIWTPYLDEQTFLISRNLIMYASQGALSQLSNWQDRYALVKQLTEEELRRHPLNTHPHFIYAQLTSSMASQMPSEIALSEREYLKALETSPKRQEVIFSLANLYLRTGRADKALDLYRQVRDFDLDLGDGHWMYGVSLFYDKRDFLNGAGEIIKSQTVRYPYALTDIRNLVALADAYSTLNNQAGMRTLIGFLPTLPPGPPIVYAEIGYRFAQLKMSVEQEQVLAFGEKIDPQMRSYFDQLIKGVNPQNIQIIPQATGTPVLNRGPRKN